MNKFVFILIIVLASFLRLYKLGSVPPSLYWDEASLGYNAYSILKTGKDEFGNFLPITNFPAFGDYKPPGYIYAAVPSIAIFKLNEFAIRFPSAFFGVLTVALTYFLAKKLFDNVNIALISSLFLAISPWHLQFSRGAFEANVGLFFSTLGIYLFIKFAQGKSFYLFFSGLAFLAGMYTFTGQRLFVPFILLVLTIYFKRQIFTKLKFTLAAALLLALLFWPLFKFATFTLEGRLRLEEVTFFKDLDPINQSIKYRQNDNFSFFSNIIHNRRLFFTKEYLINYFDAFNPNFLFTNGDVNPRLSTQEVGQLYYLDLPLLLAGLYFLIRNKEKYSFLLIGWLLVSPLGPAVARETPHALRMIHILPTYQLIAAYGLFQLSQMIKKWKVFIYSLVGLLAAANIIFYLHNYYSHWQKKYSSYWQYGYKQAVLFAGDNNSKYDHIIVTKSLGRPYIYFLLYNKFDPKEFRQKSTVFRDRFMFIEVTSFDKYIFTPNLEEIKYDGKVLYIASPGTLPKSFNKISTINDLNNDPVFEIGESR